MTTTRNDCPSTTHHGTYWAYGKHGCRCLNAAVEESIYRTRRRHGNPIELVRDATGACRTARGLAAYGYTAPQIAKASGLSERTINHLYAGKATIRAVKDRALRAAADRLIAQPKPTGWAATVARNTAKRNGWAPLHAWDNIDDPNEQPKLGDTATGEQPEGYDPIVVGFAVDGRLTYDQIKAHRADLIEAVRRLATRMSDQEIALHLRWPGAEDGPPGKTRGQGAVCQLRVRNGIPNHNAREVIAPTRSRDRQRAARRLTKAA